MCLAIQEMMEDSRLEGIEEGMEKGEAKKLVSIIDNLQSNLHCSLEEACRITGQAPAEYRQAIMLQKI